MFGDSITELYPIVAYLDPGTGSYIFQIAIAALFGLIVTIKAYWQKITSYFRKGKEV